MNKDLLVILGPPGSGKTTVSKRLSEKMQSGLIETGKLLRDEVERGTGLGEKIRSYIEKGSLVPSELVERTVSDSLSRIPEKALILDGFPRNLEEKKAFRAMKERMGMNLLGVVVIRIPREVAKERVIGRRECPYCGKIYNVYLKPPGRDGICDNCGDFLKKRSDDESEKLKNRFDAYVRETIPVVEELEEEFPGKVFRVSGEGDMDANVESIISAITRRNSMALSGKGTKKEG